MSRFSELKVTGIVVGDFQTPRSPGTSDANLRGRTSGNGSLLGRAVKEQYVGDINDFRKYILLRLLAAQKLKLGVCWMLTPGDDRPDGRKIGYLTQPTKWRHQDPDLFDILSACVAANDGRALAKIEASNAIPGASYFNELVPDAASLRTNWFAKASEFLSGSDLVFFDPDNGLSVTSIKKGMRASSKYVYRDEIAAAYDAGHSVLIYQHFPRESRQSFIARISNDLRATCPAAKVACFPTSYVAFFLALQPAHHAVDITSVKLQWNLHSGAAAIL
jgi:hypothetical protein